VLAGDAEAATALHASPLQPKVCLLVQEACTTLSTMPSWQAPREKTSTSRYSTTSLRLLHDHHDANLIGLPRDLWRLLTVMEAGGVASSLGVQEAPRRRRACVLRGVSASGRNLSQNALGVKLCLAATASHPRTPPPPARCR
jgi:hypothetical protein